MAKYEIDCDEHGLQEVRMSMADARDKETLECPICGAYSKRVFSCVDSASIFLPRRMTAKYMATAPTKSEYQ
jgi:hypothetical protein